ncbi:E3 ubiquitin-protein ligase DCST1 [Copidosoma floridanum]|uniref:E3 ubiquitin-protein ligase DCST1 n=1 Tax=Copidosoma floridanum TaxID=29053 RepID=UPI0006C99C79|nr:E3 ubiquitin-protein ligase DCST1 [Copidosoma floridanum]
MSNQLHQESNPPKKEHVLERYHDTIAQYYRSKCPSLYRIINDPAGQHERTRKFLRFGLGFTLGLLLYFFVISDLQLNALVSRICGAALIALLSLGCAYSLRFRCICLLTIPGLFGRAGRGVLKALILGYVIAGPVLNLSTNAKEVVRSFACTGQLVGNMTKAKYDLMLAPFRQAMKNLNDSADEIRRTVGSMDELIRPIAREIEAEEDEVEFEDPGGGTDLPEEEESSGYDEEEASGDYTGEEEPSGDSEEPPPLPRKRRDGDKTDGKSRAAAEYEKGYLRKISSRCKKQLNRGSETCRETFKNAYNRCYKSVTWVAGWMLCWPMKLNFACNLVETLGGNKVCDPEGKVDVGFGEGYATLKETRDKLNESLSDARIEYKIDTRAIAQSEVKDMGRAAAGVMRDFETRRRFVEGVVTFVKRCLSLVFLKIVYSATEYHSKYLTDVEHDNVYVTSYFRRVDARRRARGAPTLLPLKKLERTKLLDPYTLRQTRAEKRHLYGQTARLILEVVTVSTFVLLDKLLFELLDVIRRHARLEITQTGRHDMSLEIQGRGLVAKLVRSLVRGFNRKHRISQLLTNEACLPRPSRVPSSILLVIYGGYLLVWLLLLLQAYGQRLRRVIAGFFYHRREKRRVLHLYNESLRRRRGFLRYARSRAAQAARGRLLAPEARFWLELRENRPRLWTWLRRLGLARLDCVVCGDPEPRRGQHHTCRGSSCLAAYCEDCWKDLGRSCWATGCAPGAPSGGDDDDYDDD